MGMNLAVVGVGRFGSFALERFRGEDVPNIVDLSSLVDSVSIFDLNEEKLRIAGDRFSIPESNRFAVSDQNSLTDQITTMQFDAAFIFSNALAHADNATPFIQRKIPTYITKPLGVSSEEEDNIITARNKYDVAVASGTQCAFHPAFIYGQEILENYGVQIERISFDWRKLRGIGNSPSTGVLLEESVHPLMLANLLLDSADCEVVSAVIRKGNTYVSPHVWETVGQSGLYGKKIGEEKHDDETLFVIEQDMVADVCLMYSGNVLVNIYNSFLDGDKCRKLALTGTSAYEGASKDLYGNRFTMSIDVSDKREAVSVNSKGIGGLTYGVGSDKSAGSGFPRDLFSPSFEEIVSCDNTIDPLGNQLRGFLDYVESNGNAGRILEPEREKAVMNIINQVYSFPGIQFI